MSTLDVYQYKYKNLKFRRESGILEVQFHTDNGPLQWGRDAHREFEEAFLDIGRDYENQCVILTGTGSDFSGPQTPEGGHRHAINPTQPHLWDPIYWEGKHLLMNLLNIEVPVIGAINGPALRHAEIPLLSDITIASDTAYFQDSAHFQGGLLPGDGVHIVFPLLMGINRGRYFVLTGQKVSAKEALAIGMVNEVLPSNEVLPRAWELAHQLLRRPPLLRRYARVLLTQDLKKRMHELLGYGLALEGLSASDSSHLVKN